MLRGNAARVCQGDATWSGEEPKCYLDRNIGKVIFPFGLFLPLKRQEKIHLNCLLLKSYAAKNCLAKLTN